MKNALYLLLSAALVGSALAAYSTQTTALYDNLDTCAVETTRDIDCLEDVKAGLQAISDTIQDVRDLKTDLTTLLNGINTLSTIASFAKYAPGIGSAITVLKTTLDIIKPTIKSAKTQVTKIDNVIYPWKSRVDTAISGLDEGISWETFLKNKCTSGRNKVGKAKNCVDVMNSGTVRTNSENALESFGGAINDELSAVNVVFGNVGAACEAIRSYTDIALGWPDLSGMVNALGSIVNVLDPILDFFADFQSVLSYDLCIPNPLELLLEWELAEEIAEAVNPKNWGWKRRRRAIADMDYNAMNVRAAREAMLAKIAKKNLKDITISKDQANAVIATRASNICFSVQDILDGIDSAFSALVDLANDAINALLNSLPSFSIPGLPDFSDIFNLNFNWDLPTLDFNFDLNLYAQFYYLTWDCATNVKSVCQAVSGSITFDCSLDLNQYTVSTGRKKREIESVEYKKFLHAAGATRNIFKRSTNNDKRIFVDISLRGQHDRNDNKVMTEEEAERILQNMTHEEREKFLQRLAEKRAGNNPNHDGSTTTRSPSTTSSSGSLVINARGTNDKIAQRIVDEVRSHNNERRDSHRPTQRRPRPTTTAVPLEARWMKDLKSLIEKTES